MDLWEIAKICWKWLRDLGNGQNIWEMAYIHGTRL